MLTQSNKKHAEIYRAQVKSMAIIASTFLIANVILIIGFTSVASAQVLDASNPTLDLARMLAAPTITSGFELGSSKTFAAMAMLIGLASMIIGSVSFFSHYAKTLNQPARRLL